MKYYSELLKTFYDTAEACSKAETEAQKRAELEKVRKEKELAAKKEREEKLASERKERAKKVEEARKAMVAAQKEYKDALQNFVKDYGHYHYSSTSIDDIPTLFSSFLDWF